ncbi:MAG: hypothetical protein WAL85_05160 [Candidatus Korobacteraceae bacterium]
MAIEVKEAVEVARGFLSGIMGVAPSQLLLEEVELSDDQQFWMITFSYPAPENTSLQSMLGGGRSYKIVKLHADTGEFMSVKIRTLAAA